MLFPFLRGDCGLSPGQETAAGKWHSFYSMDQGSSLLVTVIMTQTLRESSQQGTGKARGIIQFDSNAWELGILVVPAWDQVAWLPFWFFQAPKEWMMPVCNQKRGLKLADQKVIKMWVWCKRKVAFFTDARDTCPKPDTAPPHPPMTTRCKCFYRL